MDVIKPFRFYPKEDLEAFATNLRRQVEQKRTRRLQAESVAECIADFLDLSIVWENIPPDGEGNIAAMIFPTKQTIVINQNTSLLDNGGYRQSTIGHEIGHWVLHINRQAVAEYIDREERGIEVKAQPFLCRSQKSAKGIEWQAEYFSSCLLMPQYKLIEAKHGRDLTKWGHLSAIADELGVTKSNLTYRLKSLDWIVIPNDSKQIYLGRDIPK